MSEWIAFEGEVRPMEWGDSIYTVLPIPKDVLDQLGPAKRVEIEFNDYPANLALTKAPVIDDIFVYTGKSFLKEAGIAPGAIIEIRLRPADPDHVEMPDDVTRALAGAGLAERWNALTPGKRRGLLQPVATAKRAETRAKRIERLIFDVKGIS